MSYSTRTVLVQAVLHVSTCITFLLEWWVVGLLFYYWTNSVYLRAALFWPIMQRVVVIPYQRFGTYCRSQLHGSRIQEVALFCGKVESFCPKQADFYSHIVQYFDSRLDVWEMQELFKDNFFFTCTKSDIDAWYVCKLVPQVLKSSHFSNNARRIEEAELKVRRTRSKKFYTTVKSVKGKCRTCTAMIIFAWLCSHCSHNLS